MMHEGENNFHKLWMTTAENLSVEIRYQNLNINFNYCFRHAIFQNQVYKFFVLFPGSFRTAVLSVRFVCFSSQSSLSLFVKNSIFASHNLKKQFHVFAWSTLHKSWQTLLYMWKFTWEKDNGERKVHNPVKKCTFYQYHQRFTVLHHPKICMKCCLLMNTFSKRNI